MSQKYCGTLERLQKHRVLRIVSCLLSGDSVAVEACDQEMVEQELGDAWVLLSEEDLPKGVFYAERRSYHSLVSLIALLAEIRSTLREEAQLVGRIPTALAHEEEKRAMDYALEALRLAEKHIREHWRELRRALEAKDAAFEALPPRMEE